MSDEQLVEEVKKPRGRQPRAEVLQPVVDKIAKALDTPFSGKPKASSVSVKKDIKTMQILMQTPSGRLDRKTYETYRTKNGSYKRLIKIEKGVRG